MKERKERRAKEKVQNGQANGSWDKFMTAVVKRKTRKLSFAFIISSFPATLPWDVSILSLTGRNGDKEGVYTLCMSLRVCVNMHVCTMHFHISTATSLALSHEVNPGVQEHQF